VLNIVLVIRNPAEVVDSVNLFYKNNGANSKIEFELWNKYYRTFSEIVGNIPYIVVNYKDVVEKTSEVVTRLGAFLNIPNSKPEIEVCKGKSTSNSILPAETMYIFRTLTSNSKLDSISIDNSPNAKCFCNSGKKYKRCCARF
jgi:hypothetical protein